MGEWDATTYEGKDTILRVVRQEAEAVFEMVAADDVWDRGTACARWTTRDVVGHLIDTTEGYFAAFDAARSNTDPGEPYGLVAMSQVAGDRALAFRDKTQAEMLERLRTDFDKVMELLDGIGPDDWGGSDRDPPVHGSGAGVHLRCRATHGLRRALLGHPRGQRTAARDVRRRRGPARPVHVRHLAVTIRPDADLSPFEIGIRVTSGHNAGDFRVSISPDGMSYEPGSVDDLPCVLEFDPAGLVLTAFGRCRTGTARGDRATADRFLGLFHRI